MSVNVTPVQYRPHDDAYHLDIEVLDAAELERRVASDPQRGFERVDFQCVLFVRSGSYTHTIDFETHRATPGSCLLVGPGQVHRFGPPGDWDGWMLVVGAHHVPSEIVHLPAHVRASAPVAGAIAEQLERMVADAASAIDRTQRNGLLALQVQLAVRRLCLDHASQETAEPTDPSTLTRYREYRAAIDQHFREWHLVTVYARQLGCSTKSLNRVCRAVSDVPAKRLIVERIVLEAKRLLAHSHDSVATISRELGFDEPTNFVKYFKRETQITPAQFRVGVLTPV